MKKNITPAVSKIERNGVTGANALWDGPLNTEGFPMGKGSSSGIMGMQVKKAACSYKGGLPITEIAKGARS